MLIVVLRLPNFLQSGDFYTLPYGYKREKNKGKVQNPSEARRKYGARQEKMDIKHRKSSKKVQNHPEAREKYGARQEKMDIKHRKSSKKVQNHPETREKYGAG